MSSLCSLTLFLRSLQIENLNHSHPALVTLFPSLLRPVWANLLHYSDPLSWASFRRSRTCLPMWAGYLAPSSVFHLPRTTVWLYCVILDSSYRSQACSTHLNCSRRISVYWMVLFWGRRADLRSPLQSLRLSPPSLHCNWSGIRAPVSSWSAYSCRFGRNWPFLSRRSFLAGVRRLLQFTLLTNRFSPVHLIKSWISQWTLVLGFQLLGSRLLAVSRPVRRKVASSALVPWHSE